MQLISVVFIMWLGMLKNGIRESPADVVVGLELIACTSTYSLVVTPLPIHFFSIGVSIKAYKTIVTMCRELLSWRLRWWIVSTSASDQKLGHVVGMRLVRRF